MQKILPVVVGKTRDKNPEIFANNGEVAVLTSAYTYIILLNLRDPVLVGVLLLQWMCQQIPEL